MTTEKLKDMLNARPFKPFALRLADGQRIDVHHPEFAHPSPGGRTVLVFEPRKPGEEDEHFRIVDLLLVTSLETLNHGRKRGQRRSP